MGCNGSNGDFGEPLDQELENEFRYVDRDKNDKQVDRFEGNKPQQGFDGFFDVENQANQQFMAVKPWIGALVEPSQRPQFVSNAPEKNLKLQFINGFKVQDSRQNIFWGKNKDEIIYCAAAVGINMNVNTLKQKYMGVGERKTAKGHTDDIVSLGICPQRKLVVTGSLGARPLIIVWDSETMQEISRTNLGRNTRAVSTIRFSKDGKLFFCSDKSNDSNVYCFNAKDCAKVGQQKCGSDPIFCAQSGLNNTFACGTKRGAWFFQYNGSSLEKKRGIFGQNRGRSMVTMAYDPDSNCFYGGAYGGLVYTWQGNTCTKVTELHKGTVMCIAYASGKMISSGYSDNLLKITEKGELIAEIEIPSYAKSLDLFNGSIICGTKCGQILTINESTKAVKQIMQGHWTGQTWGLDIASDGTVYTTADDNSVLGFNPKSHKVQKKGIVNATRGKKYRIGGASTLSLLPPNQQSRAVAVSKAGHVAIGTNQGYFSVRTATDLSTQVMGTRIAKQWIQVMKYSPDQTKIAVGSHDNNIYILDVGKNYETLQVLKAHNSFITNLDWSRDGNAIQSNCGAYEYLFFDVNSGQQLKSGASQFKDQKWASYSVKLGWWVQGIFPRAMSGDHVNGVERSHNQAIVATGDDWGFVNIYRNPALKSAKCVSFRAHSSHVVRVKFTPDDSYLYSVGGYDKTLMMWKCE